jgi:hypothetical protein
MASPLLLKDLALIFKAVAVALFRLLQTCIVLVRDFIVTPQKAQIQALINDIDRVLGKASPRLPWVMSGDATQQRQVLEQTRNYLIALQQQVSAPEFEPSRTGGDLVAYGASASLGVQPQPGQGATVESAQQVLQAVLEEMSYLRANVMQPLRSDIEEMSQRRDSLVQEIKQLEADRQQYALPQSDEFFQTLRARLREDLAGQMTQMVASLESDNSEMALGAASEASDLEVSSSQSLLTPAQRLKQLQAIQSQSDQLILKLDTTLRVVFDSLQDSVKSYQESLGQGLDRMHSLGQQGEAMFAALMGRLAGELGRGASSYLQSSIETTDWEPRPTLQGVDQLASPGVAPADTVEDTPSQPGQVTGEDQLASVDQLPAEQVTDAEIDKLLNELNEIAPSTASDQTLEQTNVEDSMSASAASVAPVTDSELEDLDLLTFELDDLPLEVPPDADDITVFQVGDDFQLTEAGLSPFPESSAENTTLFQNDQFEFPFEEPPAATTETNLTAAASEPQIADLDSALDLLNQLSVELHEEPAEDEPESPPAVLESAIVPEPPDEDESELLPTDSVEMSAAPVASPDNLYNQLDDFYQNMFGAGENAAAGQSEARLTDLAPGELAADLGVEPIATPTSPEPVQEANIPGDLVNESSEQAIAPLDDAFLSSELSDELFGGLTDPAELTDDTRLSLPPEVLVDETSADQPLEDFPLDLGLEDFPLTDLLSEPDSISADASEMTLADEEILPVVEDESEDVTAELLPPPQSQSTPPDEIDTIANLSDLLESTPAEVEPQIQPELTVQPEASAPIEDPYVTAAPDEDLLATEEFQTDPRVDLQLDPDVLEQLTADLSNLEGLQGSNLSALEADLETTESPDWTFVDWDETEPAAGSASPSVPEPLLEDVNFLEPEIEVVEPAVEPVSEVSSEAIASSDVPPSVSSETPDTIDDLFFPDTSDLSDLLSYQEAIAAEVADQEISSFEDEELGNFGDQELDTFTSESITDLPLLDQNTTLSDLFSPAPNLSTESDLELEDDLLTDDFEDLTSPASSQRETTLEELFAIAEVDTTAPSPSPSETETPDVSAPSFEQSPPEASQPDYDLALEDLFALPPDDLDAAPLPEGEYVPIEQDELQFTESPSSSWTSETTLEGLFDLPGSEAAQPSVESQELTLDDFVQEVAAPDDVPVLPSPSDPLDESSSAVLDFADFENLELEQPNIQEEPDTFTLEGLDSLFEEVSEAESQPSAAPSNQVDAPTFESSPGLEAASEDWTLENAFSEPEPPAEYGSATDLDFLEAVPPVEYGSTTDLYTADLDPLELPDAEYGSATDLPPFEVDSEPEAISSLDLDFLGIEPADTEDAEKKTLNSDLTGAFEPDLEFADVNFADAEFAELTPDLIIESEPEPETGLGLPNDELSDSSAVEEAVELELPELEPEITPEAELELPEIEPEITPEAELELPELEPEITPEAELEFALEDGLTDSTIASSDDISAELPVESPFDVPGSPIEISEEEGVDDWSDRLPADFDPSDLPAARLNDANPFPDIALLDPGFGLPGLESGLQGEIPPSGESAEEPVAKDWYLGIDFGTTGISAVLLNRSTCELYPIYWSEARPQDQGGFVADKSFRLPAIVYLSTGRDTPIDPNLPSPNQDQAAVTSVAIGSLALDLNQRSQTGGANFDADSWRLLLRDFKPYLGIGVPHYSPQTSGWEPVLQWSDQHPLEMSWLHQALQTLLATLSYHRLSTPAHSALSCAAVGLDAATFQTALRQLAGVVMGYPANWSDTYSFNIREAVLGARLVAHPEQIFFIEDAIATLLSGLRSSDGRAVVLPNNLSQKPYLYNTDWQGSTLVISAGASVTEMALVDLPSALQNLTYQDFTLRSLPYAGKALDQDIICQLLYPAWSRQSRRSDTTSEPYSFGSGQTPKSSAFADGWHWQPTESDAETMTWASLELENLTLPSAGEPDPLNRQRLQQRLESSPMGQSLLEAARYLKLILQQQDRFNLELGDQQWTVMRRELGSRVLLPYIQRLNRELNALLTQSGVPIQSINQVICTGGTASFGAIARWLRQKLPNATIIQDTYTNSRAGSTQESRLPTCSRVAYGLATLPLHSQVLNLPRQQYSDYFLLMELLRAFPDQPLSLSQIMQMLERRGINTQACRLHILALLEGHLPPGLVPTEKHTDLLAQQSKQNPDYQMLLAAPLFQKLDSQTYRPNYQQWNHFRSYLSTITASTHQKLSEPLTVGLSVSTQE